jgi:hypothetical protein
MTERSFDISGEFGKASGIAPQPVATFAEPPAVAPETALIEEEIFAFTGVEKVADLPLPRVDPIRGVFITSRGDEIQLSDKPVNGLVVERLAQDGKPEIPLVEVKLVGGRKQLEPHPGHEGYKAQLQEWELKSKIRTLKYLFCLGVKGQPPQSFIDEHYTFFPDASDLDMKYLWVASLVPDDDIDPITEAIMGRSLPTTKAVDEVANFTE